MENVNHPSISAYMSQMVKSQLLADISIEFEAGGRKVQQQVLDGITNLLEKANRCFQLSLEYDAETKTYYFTHCGQAMDEDTFEVYELRTGIAKYVGLYYMGELTFE